MHHSRVLKIKSAKIICLACFCRWLLKSLPASLACKHAILQLAIQLLARRRHCLRSSTTCPSIPVAVNPLSAEKSQSPAQMYTQATSEFGGVQALIEPKRLHCNTFVPTSWLAWILSLLNLTDHKFKAFRDIFIVACRCLCPCAFVFCSQLFSSLWCNLSLFRS